MDQRRLLVVFVGLMVLAYTAILVFRGKSNDDSGMDMSDYDITAIDEAIKWQMESYPQSTLKDLYKNFFQDAFGPGHLKSSAPDAEDRMRNSILSECESIKDEKSACGLYEKTGYHGRFYRVDLSVLTDEMVPFDTFFEAFSQSAERFSLPEVSVWSKEWSVIQDRVEILYPNLPDFSKDKKEISEILERGEYASHHSDAYDKAYHPHYRLIEAGIFKERILPLLGK